MASSPKEPTKKEFIANSFFRVSYYLRLSAAYLRPWRLRIISRHASSTALDTMTPVHSRAMF